MLASLPEPEYRAFSEARKVALKLYARTNPVIEVEIKVRRLVTPAVRDVVSGGFVQAAQPSTMRAGGSSIVEPTPIGATRWASGRCRGPS
jgi:hypothetical protein